MNDSILGHPSLKILCFDKDKHLMNCGDKTDRNYVSEIRRMKQAAISHNGIKSRVCRDDRVDPPYCSMKQNLGNEFKISIDSVFKSMITKGKETRYIK